MIELGVSASQIEKGYLAGAGNILEALQNVSQPKPHRMHPQ